MTEQQPDWEISDLYKKSWEFIKENKVTWAFGMALAGLGGGFQGSGNYKSFFDLSKTASTADTGYDTLISLLHHLISGIPPFFYGIAILEIALVIIYIIIVTLIYKAWAQASLLTSIQKLIENKKSTMQEASQSAFPRIKSLIWLNLVPGLILGFSTFIIFGSLILGLVFSPVIVKIVLGIALLIAIGFFVYIIVYLSLSSVWAQRIIVVDKKSGKEALFAGYRLVKKKKWPMILLGLVNSITTGMIVGIPLIIMIALIAGGIFGITSNNTGLGISLIFVGTLLIIPFVLCFLLLSGILTAFKASTWSIAYNNIRGKYEQ